MTTIDVLYGFPGDNLSRLQHAGVATAGLSGFCYLSLFFWIYLYGIGSAEELSFSKWPLAERLFIHMSVLGTVCQSCHLLDHMRILAMYTQEPSATCRGLGAMMHTQLLVDVLVLVYATASACVLFRWQATIPMGPYDGGVVVLLYVVPLVLSLLLVLPGFMGPTGAWCFIDFSSKEGQEYSLILVIIILVIFIACLVLFVYLTCVTFSSKLRVNSEAEAKNVRTVQSLLVFTPLCLVHWSGLLIFMLWSQLQVVPFAAVVATTVIVNLGGVFQCMAYAFIRGSLKNPPGDLVEPVRFQLAKIGYDTANMANRMKRFSSETSFQTKGASVATSTTTIDNNLSRHASNKSFPGLQYVEDIEI